MDTHTIVVGAGTGGATVAGLLAEQGTDVLLLEAGPDYGPQSQSWPADMLDARVVPTSHDWGHTSETTYPDRVLDLPRAKIVGGCSAHNGCTAAVGAHADWEEWGLTDVEPLIDLVRERFRVRALTLDELTPVQRAFVDAGIEQGLPLAHDLHELTAGVGIGPMAVNVVDGVRYNAAFAFLDGVRDRLTIQGDTLVERVLIEGGRARGVVVGGETVRARRVIVAGGAYMSPALLLRSGIGPADDLHTLGIDVVADLPVGENLLDHPCVALDYAGSERFRETLASTPYHPDEQTVGRARSSRCDDGPYDIHVFLVAGANTGHPGLPPISLYGGAMRARSQGRVTLRDADPTSLPLIDHRYLSDEHDLQVLTEARDLLERMVRHAPFAAFLGERVTPADFDIRARVVNYCHPAGSCARAVDSSGAVRGVDGLHVADASIMPTITRGNPNLPVAVLAAGIARSLR
ncbi:GMC family oxidoreductase [Solirubrobacter soli]|uniref:GMC family oxidoreductase n=1 Tax=Solirubrobacter soli TaxID=363832 RepID=UPI0003F85966|nr:GMC family oxidoreductase [Solirubrobacter soli]